MSISKRLRDRSDHYLPDWAREVMDEAAVEIERLNALISTMAGDLVEAGGRELDKIAEIERLHEPPWEKMYNELEQRHVALAAKNERLRSQLPEGMKDCTILFKECELGHGRLTATNWIDHGCPHCKLNEAAAFLDGLAGYLEREADAARGSFKERDLRQEVADCRAQAAKLRGET